jgi:hypothetical protein
MVDAPTAIVVRRRDGDAEAESILDRLEATTGVPGRRFEDGRTYDLSASRDWLVTVTSMRAHLDAVSEDWPAELEFGLKL